LHQRINKMTNQQQRLKIIHKELSGNKNGISLSILARKLNCSEPTVKLDLKKIRKVISQFRFQQKIDIATIESYKSKTEWLYKWTDGKKILKVEYFQSEDIQNLSSKIDKLELIVPNQISELLMDKNTKAKKKVFYENSIFTKNQEYCFKLIIEALKNEQVVRIKYNSYNNKTEICLFHPHVLNHYNNRWFIFGQISNEDGDIKVSNSPSHFALDRINKVDILAGKNFIPADNKYYTDYISQRIGVSNDKSFSKIETIVVEVKNATRFYVQSKPLHSTQKNIRNTENAIHFEYRLMPNYEFFSKIRELGTNATIISPESVRSYHLKQLKETLENYE
jgi:predicted DNA-binding transcriptional regulator YafY